jgi:HPt (histidine-containing phosphotransfer) domain-containing protein
MVLDHEQLRSITLYDEELMRELLQALIDDTSTQLTALEAAMGAADGGRLARLAHSCKGACANLGAASSAAILQNIERHALAADFPACNASLAALAEELQKLQREAACLLI